MHWTAGSPSFALVTFAADSGAREASRALESAAKVTGAKEVLPTFGLRATSMELPNIERILAVNITV